MAYKFDLHQTLRLSNYVRIFCSDLAVPVAKEKEMGIWRRLEMKVDQLRKGCSWKKIQELLEAEAISKVAVKGLLRKLLAISQELSEMTELSVEEIVILLLRLFIQEPITSTLLKQIMKHVFGSIQPVIIHRIYQIVGDIVTVLPPYTLQILQERPKRLGHGEELFGKCIKFVSLDRNKIVFPNVTHLHDISLMNENVETEYLEDEAVNGPSESDEQKLPGENFRSPIYRIYCQHFENQFYEEVNLYTSSSITEDTDNFMPVPKLDKAGQRVFEGKEHFNAVESAVFQSVFCSDKNVVITLPFGFDKTDIILLAVLNLLVSPSKDIGINTHQFKILYLVSSKEAAKQIAQELRNRLVSLGIDVRYYTATAHFRKADFESTRILVTTVNVWRVLANTLDDQNLEFLRLLIIDEMNWLQENCGPALETIVARFIGQGKSGRRVLGFTMSLLPLDCSSTFSDMASFLHVDSSNTFMASQHCVAVLPRVHLFKIRAKESDKYRKTVDEICCTNVDKAICDNKKVVVFVNSDADAVHTAEIIREVTYKHLKCKLALKNSIKKKLLKFMAGSKFEACRSLCSNGYLVIHSGMTAQARKFTSYIFRRGIARFIVVTSNFVWMLPNQVDTVIIKETEVHSDESGSLVDMGISTLVRMLSVAMFPIQKDTKTYQGKAFIVSCSRFEQYLALFQNQHLVDSRLMECLPDSLNTEIIFGNISSIMDCQEWFKCTYLYQRMRSRAVELDTSLSLDEEVTVLVSKALETLEKAGMIRFLRLGSFTSTELGHIANCHNISHTSMEIVGKYVRTVLTMDNIVNFLSKDPVFLNIQVKEAETDELTDLEDKYCKLLLHKERSGGRWKSSILLQTYLFGGKPCTSGLQREQAFVVKKMVNLARAMFEVNLNKRNATMAKRSLQVAKMIEKGVWNICKETTESPKVQIEAHFQPISRTVLQVIVFVTPAFSWKEEMYGVSPVLYWLWIEDSNNNFICNHRCFRLTRKVVETKTCVELTLPVTAVEPLPDHFTVCAVSDKWLGAVHTCNVMFQEVVLPNCNLTITGLLDLQLLPISVLKKEAFEKIYSFHRFSPVITQAFHSLYHRDCNVLLAASSSQDRVTAAELAIFRAMSKKPGSKVVYLNSMKSEVKKKLVDWQNRFKNIGWKLASLSGDISEDIQTFFSADILVTMTYHWEITSRARKIQKCMEASKVSLIILDELQVMDIATEAVVSRVRAPGICSDVRLIGLSCTALAYINDVAHFLGIPPNSPQSIYNFGCVSNNNVGKSITGVQVVGFMQKQYTTRMTVMSQAVGDTIQEHLQSNKCVSVIVPTRRQVLLTAQVLKKRVVNSSDSRIWLQCQGKEEANKLACAQDLTVRAMLEHGIGMLHSGMSEADSDIVQDLANSRRIRVLILSWDMVSKVQIRSHVLIIKGTEQYSVSMGNYIDIPVPEIADKIYSCSSSWKKAFIFTQDSKKALYQALFQDALRVESRLLATLPEYLNNEIVSRTLKSKTSALEHLCRSYLGQRLVSSPSYYLGYIFKQESEDCRSLLVDKLLCSLKAAGCVTFGDSGELRPTLLGSLSSSRELCHGTVKYLSTNLNPDMTQQEMTLVVCHAEEFKELPVRIHDCELIRMLEKHSRWVVDFKHFLPIVVKVFLLLQSHFSRLGSSLTSFVDYASDMKEVLDAAKIIVKAAVVICSDRGWLKSALQAQLLLQMLVVGSWGEGNAPFLTPSNVAHRNLKLLTSEDKKTVRCLPELQTNYGGHQIHKTRNKNLPILNVQLRVLSDSRSWMLKEMYDTVKIGGKMVQLSPRREYTLSVEFKEAGVTGSWRIMLGLKEELQAMKTVNTGVHKVFLIFQAPDIAGDVIYSLYVVSNSHIGLDQQFDLHFKIVPTLRSETAYSRNKPSLAKTRLK